MIIHVQFVVVAGKGDRKQFEAYNYDHDVIQFEDSRGYFVGLLRVESPTADRTAYLADYQANRYRSGRFASDVFDAKPRQDELADYLDKHCPQAFA